MGTLFRSRNNNKRPTVRRENTKNTGKRRRLRRPNHLRAPFSNTFSRGGEEEEERNEDNPIGALVSRGRGSRDDFDGCVNLTTGAMMDAKKETTTTTTTSKQI